MEIDVYSKCLRMNKFDRIVEHFHETIIDTNRDHKFFVDWKKIQANVQKSKIELNILNSLIGSKNFKNDLRQILSRCHTLFPNSYSS